MKCLCVYASFLSLLTTCVFRVKCVCVYALLGSADHLCFRVKCLCVYASLVSADHLCFRVKCLCVYASLVSADHLCFRVKCLCVYASLVSADHLCFRPASSTDKAASPFLQRCHAQRHHEQHTRYAPGTPSLLLTLSLPQSHSLPPIHPFPLLTHNRMC